MKRALAVLVPLFALAVSPFSASANHSWGGYHWARTTSSFTLKLGDNLSSVWKPYLTTTSTDWSKSTVLDTTIVAGQSTSRCRATSGRVEVCNSTYGNNGWLGLASISASGSHITQGTVKLNDTYFNQSQYNTTSERNHVMCQEVGHTLGLDHQDTSGATLGTCMDYSQSTTSQHPNTHDYDELKTIYGHLDSTTTVGAPTLAGKTPDLSNMDSPAAWGTLVKSEGNGREQTFVRDFGGGQKVYTFVTWAK